MLTFNVIYKMLQEESDNIELSVRKILKSLNHKLDNYFKCTIFSSGRSSLAEHVSGRQGFGQRFLRLRRLSHPSLSLTLPEGPSSGNQNVTIIHQLPGLLVDNLLLGGLKAAVVQLVLQAEPNLQHLLIVLLRISILLLRTDLHLGVKVDLSLPDDDVPIIPVLNRFAKLRVGVKLKDGRIVKVTNLLEVRDVWGGTPHDNQRAVTTSSLEPVVVDINQQREFEDAETGYDCVRGQQLLLVRRRHCVTNNNIGLISSRSDLGASLTLTTLSKTAQEKLEHDSVVNDNVEGGECHEQRAGVHCTRNKRMLNQIINGFQEAYSEISKLDFEPRKRAKKPSKVTNMIFINKFLYKIFTTYL